MAMTERDSRFSDPDAQCVWVSAGLLNDHVCDRDFDCDHCPLHLALSPVAGRKEPDRSFWPKDRLYSDRHFWLKQMSARSARLGLTETAVQLLHPVSRWELDTTRGAPVRITASLACGQVVLLPHCHGSQYRVNPCLEIDALWPTADPWLSGYLLEFEFADWRETREGWMELAQAAPHFAQHREFIHRALQAGTSRPLADATAADGGLPASGLWPVVGRAAYGSLIAGILGCVLEAPPEPS
jgi:hypothetical protein